jgi:hypothetical protein
MVKVRKDRMPWQQVEEQILRYAQNDICGAWVPVVVVAHDNGDPAICAPHSSFA